MIKYSVFVFFVLNNALAVAQGSFFLKENVSDKISFQLINNLIIVPLEINGIPRSFILDTGASRLILFNLKEKDSLDLKNTKSFYIHGLGVDGELKALKSTYNRVKFGNAVVVNQDLYVVRDADINFAVRFDVPIHGIIGYDIFKDFVVEINYRSKYIRLHKSSRFKPKTSKKWREVPLIIQDRKPYTQAKVTLLSKENPVKLLIDTGSSDALWLFEDENLGLIPNKDLVFDDYLGKGLSGSIYGKRSKINNFKISYFNLEDVNVAFPDSLSINISKVRNDRNGSIGGNVLKRFNHFFDYRNNKLYIKKNSNFKAPFTYNNSGIVVEKNGSIVVREEFKNVSIQQKGLGNQSNTNNAISNYNIGYRMLAKPKFKIVELRKTSNAYAAGLREGDIIIRINKKLSYKHKLSDINSYLYGKTGKRLSLTILRRTENLEFKFKLDNVFNKNEPSN